jgi:vacuolar-type H+-ATPase subunit I/STV1
MYWTVANKQLPGPELEMSLEEYARTVCAIMDVPVYDNIVESLHLLFTIFQVLLFAFIAHTSKHYYISYPCYYCCYCGAPQCLVVLLLHRCCH